MSLIATNQLGNSTSVYLRQHADNPVHWQKWNAETLNLAKQLQKPILLSIGYSACHWCHVMARESFSNPDIANLMNAYFINIKVDREERPDLDHIYMSALTAMGEQGGWPLTMFLTPEAKPFWGGTYFPPVDKFGMPGFPKILNAVHQMWINEQNKIQNNNQIIFDHIHSKLATTINNPTDSIDPILLFNNYSKLLLERVDPIHGGLLGKPKFPSSTVIECFYYAFRQNQNSAYLNSFLKTLKHMLQGGTYDHINGGLFRYSTDEKWLVPHFEKMLYDNALMIRQAAWAYQHTKDQLFLNRIDETVQWLISELQLPDGSFAASLSAETNGQEGQYYTWHSEELKKLLKEDYSEFADFYNISTKGNWEGVNILNRLHDVDNSTVPETVMNSLQIVRQARMKRQAPERDDKCLFDWNALMVTALAEAGQITENHSYIALANNLFLTLLKSFDAISLPHSKSGADITIGFSSDYAAMITAALSLYKVFKDKFYLETAQSLAAALDHWHRDEENNYRFTRLQQSDVIMHIYADQDDATPSPTSQIIQALHSLALQTGNQTLLTHIENVAQRALQRIENLPYGQAGLINACLKLKISNQLIIVYSDENDPLIQTLKNNFDPLREDIFVKADQFPLHEYKLPNGILVSLEKPAALFCSGFTCQLPIYNSQELDASLNKKPH